MDISTEKLSHAAIVKAIGRLDAAGAPMVEASCRALIQEKPKYLLLDMAAIHYVSSAGLRSLLVLAKAMKAANGTLLLCSLTPSVREVMGLSGLDNILTLAADRSAALRLMQ